MTKQNLEVSRPRLFGIGWPKSGLKALYDALILLKFKALNTDIYQHQNPTDNRPSLMFKGLDYSVADPLHYVTDWIAHFDAVVGWPIHRIWPKLFEFDPTAKFIFIYDSPDFLAFECARHNWKNCKNGRKIIFTSGYERTLREIEEYYDTVFAAAVTQPQRFLILSRRDSDEHKWSSLCEFTNCDKEQIKVAGRFPEWPQEYSAEQANNGSRFDKIIVSLQDNPQFDGRRVPMREISQLDEAQPVQFIFGDGQSTTYSKNAADDNFAIITCHWNPAGWYSLRQNYQRFLYETAGWDAPVYSAEIAYVGQSWASETTTFKIRGTEHNLIWQKERLLNYIVERLPEKYTKIAWIDADFIMFDPFWIKKAKTLLDEYPLVYLWNRLFNIGTSGELIEFSRSPGHMGWRYINKKTWSPGGAIAGWRSLFPIYERHPTGANDNLCLEGWVGSVGCQVTDKMKQNFDVWSAEAYSKTKGKITNLLADCAHMYHGSKKNRNYSNSRAVILDNNFDPTTHIHVDENGIFAWSDNAPKLIVDYLRNLFGNRLEDDAGIPDMAYFPHQKLLSNIRSTTHG